MNFVQIVKNHYKEALLLALIIAIYFLFRLPNLTALPIFADEAIYIRWAQVMKAEPTLRFLPLSDGKTPLFMWAMMPVFKLIEDPLLAGRILAVFSGLGTLIGVFILGAMFFNKRVGLWSAFLIAITPYIIFFDRMALVDSLLACFVVWSILFTLILIKYQRIDLAMVLGYFMGASLLTKTPAILNIYSLPLAAVTLSFASKGRLKRILKVAGLFSIAGLISFVIYNALRLGPGFSSLSSRNEDYVRDPMDLLRNPLDPFIPHFRDMVEWWPLLLGYPLIIAIVIGIFFGIVKKNRTLIALLLISLAPTVVEMALLRTFTARYLLFPISPLLIIAAFGLDNLVKFLKRNTRIVTAALVLILMVWPAYFTNKLLFDFENTPLPKNERQGYMEDWTAGYGLREIASYLNEESKKGLIIVGTEGSFGTLPDGLQIYFDKNRQVVFKPGGSTISAELREEAKKLPTFYVANQNRLKEFADRVELISRYPKAMPKDTERKQDAMVLFKVNP